MFTILTVCTGNICRSPYVHFALANAFKNSRFVTVESAGTGALVGQGMTQTMLDRAVKHGISDGELHRSRQLTADMISNADLVLPLARDHRRAIVELSPSAIRRTFTLREFARIVEQMRDSDLLEASILPQSDIVSRLRAGIDAAATLRGIVAPPTSPEADDVTDPYRQGDQAYDHSVAQMVPAIDSTLNFFTRAAKISG